jgi:hypothetical protein
MVIKNNQFLFTNEKTPKLLAQEIATKYNSFNKIFYIIGIIQYGKKHGLKDLREFVEKKFSKRTWYRVKDSINEINQINTIDNQNDYIKTIESQLNKFQSYKKEDYINYFH